MMINQNTKISKVIEANPLSIDAISSINKHFKKLQNPILRKILASRVTVKDAAAIGGVSVTEFLQNLANIGMDVEFPIINQTTEIHMRKFDIDPNNLIQLDVRPAIEKGADPFSEIMAVIKTLKNNQIIEIINVFEPIPLMKVLEKQGFDSFTEKINSNQFHTYFKLIQQKTHNETDTPDLPILDDFDTKMVDFGSNLLEIDVRQLEMPEPMMKILDSLSSLPENFGLFVHHKKVPQFLLPELKSRNYLWLTKEIEDGYVQMLIFNKMHKH